MTEQYKYILLTNQVKKNFKELKKLDEDLKKCLEKLNEACFTATQRSKLNGLLQCQNQKKRIDQQKKTIKERKKNYKNAFRKNKLESSVFKKNLTIIIDSAVSTLIHFKLLVQKSAFFVIKFYFIGLC